MQLQQLRLPWHRQTNFQAKAAAGELTEYKLTLTARLIDDVTNVRQGRVKKQPRASETTYSLG